MVEVRVNGQNYDLFKQVDVSRSMNDFSGECRIITTEPVNNISFITTNDKIEILLDGVQILTGYAENISDSETNDSHDISYRARDLVMDIIDSSCPDNVKAVENVTSLKQLCQLVIDGLGLDVSVIDNVGATFSEDLKAAGIGESAGSFLQKYARKVGVFLNTDGKGNIFLQQPGGKLKTILANIPGFLKNNIKESNYSLDDSKRYGKIIVRSNGNLTSQAATGNLGNSGEASDPDIRSTRILEMTASSPMTAAECKKNAEEEVNIRRCQAFSYSCTVAGFSANGELWEPGRLVNVKDEKKGVIGLFLITECQWSFSASGEITKMTITYPDAYTANAEQSPAQKKTTKAGTTYTIQRGDTLSQLAEKFGISIEMLMQANPKIKNRDLINADDTLIIPIEQQSSVQKNIDYSEYTRKYGRTK